jgi:hypothetical protein
VRPQRGNTYRYFLTASQLLNDIKANPLNLGGVLFWDKRFGTATHPPATPRCLGVH